MRFASKKSNSHRGGRKRVSRGDRAQACLGTDLYQNLKILPSGSGGANNSRKVSCMRSQLNLSGSPRLLLVLLALTSDRYLQAQGGTSQLHMEAAPVELTRSISLDDLRNGDAALESLRSQRRAACLKQDTKPNAYCLWAAPLPTALERTAPHAAFDRVSGVWDPPFRSYGIARIQNFTALATFAPVAQVTEGAETLKRWTEYADSGQLIECANADSIPDEPHRWPDNLALRNSSFPALRAVSMGIAEQDPRPQKASSCLVIVHSLPPPSGDLAFLSLCQVILINGLAGAPADCIPISASSSTGQWALAYTGGFEVLLADNGKPDFLFNLFYSRGSRVAGLHTNGHLQMEDVLGAAELAIRSTPLKLQTRISTYVLGIGPRRHSDVLPGNWNEEVTVRIDVDPTYSTDSTTNVVVATDFDLEVSTTILVNQQKDSDPKHWHQPDPTQTQVWTDAIKRRLREELSHLCASPRQPDDFKLVCN